MISLESMSSTTVSRLNKSETVRIYWIFIYSYGGKSYSGPLPTDKILIFPFNYYTPFRNRGLPTLVVDKPLDFSEDSDLDLVLTKFNLKNVQSISEMSISSNTNLLAIEVDPKKELQGYTRHNHLFFYTSTQSPEHYISGGTFNGQQMLKNHELLRKLKVNIGSKFLVTTSVMLGQVFSFVCKDHFESIFNIKEVEPKKLTAFQLRLEEKGIIQEEPEEEETDGYETSDSQLSLYSYNQKHNIKDIQ
jgi:hypothetical protein